MANVNAPFGSTFISIIIYAFLFGLATIQTLLFFKFNDRLHVANKVAVGLLWIMLGLELSFVTHFVYHFVIQADVTSTETKILWSWTAYTAVDFLLLSFAQMLYAVRLWQLLTLLNHRILRALIFSLLAILLGASIALSIYLPYRMSVATSSLEFIRHAPYVLLALSNGSLIDFLLSCNLSYGLIKAAGMNFGWTNSSLVVLLAYIMNTGTFAAIFSVGAVIAYALDHKSLTFLAFRIVHVGLYFNSFLVMMNSRFYFQDIPEPEPENHIVSYHTSDDGEDFTTRRVVSNSSSFNGEIRGCTINEVGLPLFKGDACGHPRKQQSWNDEVKTVEIKVEKQHKQAYHRAPRPLYRVERSIVETQRR